MGPADTDLPVPSPAVGGDGQVSPPRTLLGVAAAVAVAAWLARVATDGPVETVAGSALELAALVALLAWAGARWLPIREVAAGIGRWRVAAVVALVVAVLAGQHLRHVDLYPFEPWDMYTEPVEASGYLELRMRSGRRDLGPLPLADAVPTTAVRAYLSGLQPYAVRASGGDAEAEAVVTRAVRAVVAELGRDDVEVVTARRCVVQEPTRDDPADCQVLLDIPVDPAGTGP
ncbi:MAG TPA: hypothetical protein VEW93_08295 [Acidimicrobiales bacterium]|nr:hypothetical protein [Acidimicrobiales bacterium]